MRYFLCAAVFLLCVYTRPAQAQSVFSFPDGCTEADYMQGRVIVKFLPGITERVLNTSFIQVCQSLNADSIVQKFAFSPVPVNKVNEWGFPLVDLSLIYEIHFSQALPVDKAINALLMTNLFEYVVPHYIDQLLYTPNDPNIGSQYYLNNIKAYSAWNILKGDTNKVIAITDTGYEFNHPDLVGAVKYNYNDPIDGIDNDNDGYVDNFKGWDMGSGDNNPQYDAYGHGIHVSGIAGASADNGFGIAGVGFKCKLLPVKVDNTYGNMVATYESIVYAADHGADVINCSWGSTYSGTPYAQDIINYATYNCNALVVAACGNSNNSMLCYPASYKNVLSVAGTDASDHKWGNSSFGYMVDICAPGSNIYSSWAGASFTTSSGTSMASPMVSAAAAIVSSYYPQFNMLQVAERLRTTADVIDTIPYNAIYNRMLGMGRLNMYRALTDSLTPSIRLLEGTFSDSADMEFFPGDTLFINAKIINYLDTSSSVTYARIECLTPNVMLLDSIWTIGVLNPMNDTVNYADPFRVKLLNVPPSTDLQFLIHFYDGPYHSADYLHTFVNKDYLTLDTNLITMTVTSKGTFAFNNAISMTQGEGLRFDGNSNMVSLMGLMCGTDGLHVSDNLYSIINPVDSDFVSGVFVSNSIPAPYGDKCLFTEYSDDGAAPSARLKIRVKQWAYAWDTPEDDNFVLLRFQIISDSLDLNNFYAGLFADWDVVTVDENRCWFDASHNALIATTTDSSIMVATRLLTPQNSYHYAVDMDGFNSSISIYDGFSGVEKHTMMSSNRNLAGAEVDGNDIASLISAGPCTILADDTLNLTFVVVAGYNLQEIAQGLDRAIVRYNDPELALPEFQTVLVKVFPNPASGSLSYVSRFSDDPVLVSIFDASGKNWYNQNGLQSQGSIDISSLPVGIYFIRFTTGQETQVLTFTVIR